MAPWPTHGSIIVHVENCGQQAVRHGVAFKFAFRGDAEIEPRQTGQREDGGVEFGPVGDFLHPRADVAADFDDVEVGSLRQQLRFAARAAGGDGRARRENP